MKIIIIIPTLNEIKSLENLINKINNIKIKKIILFVDDQSTDGTQEKIKSFSRKRSNIKYLFKKKDFGIGSAIRSGLKYAKKNNFTHCITMDADGTHNPKIIPIFIKLIKKNNIDIVSTNRFLNKKSIKKWSYIRILITRFRYILVKLILNTKLDSTGNFRCYNLKKIKYKHLFLSKNKFYFFLIESLFYFEVLKYKIKEIPIYLSPRTNGYSKMKVKHIINSLLNLIKLKFQYEYFMKKKLKIN